MSNHDPTGVIIDAAIPRTPQERCQELLNHAHELSQQYNVKDDRFGKYDWEIEYYSGDDEYDWHEFEDDIIDLIEYILPDTYCVDINDGDVLIMGGEHEQVHDGTGGR